ncbi:MAG TPA: iron transporter [Solirubrobacteraceae bacterium]
MFVLTTWKRRAPLIVAVGLLAAGCSSTKGGSTSGSASRSTSTSTMAGMNMGAAVPSVNGIKAVPTQVLATATWQNMKIEARTMTPSTFLEYQGTTPGGSVKLKTVHPTKHDSFHLMVMLNDIHSGYPIPYAQVWATISRAGKIVYDDEQWPMLSEYMGPHYGNNVALPGPGHYQLSLLISPPTASRHLEYRGMWMSPHRVNVAFNWSPPK